MEFIESYQIQEDDPISEARELEVEYKEVNKAIIKRCYCDSYKVHSTFIC